MHLEVALSLQFNSCSQVLPVLSEVVGFEFFINLTCTKGYIIYVLSIQA